MAARRGGAMIPRYGRQQPIGPTATLRSDELWGTRGGAQ
jgi:hypothetical protein